MSKYSIYKYPVEPDFLIQVYDMPKGAVILSFGLDGNNQLCFWAHIDKDAPLEARKIACVGTGWDLTALYSGDTTQFIGTTTHGPYVWHLFDMGAVEGRIQEAQART
jgi:hypothetical protein